ncbi:MAG TPA: EAL domain-containing protein [Solirubrobacterales bacterium]|nr:EAL domain-containing protein [Solirubrobacterales bacterium]
MPSTPGADAIAERQIAFRLASTRVGMALTAMASVGSAAYALTTWNDPNRSALLILAAVAMVTVPLIWALPRERIIRSRWREAFFVVWTALLLICIAVATAADGGLASPYRALFILPILFAGLSYPQSGVVVTGALAVLAYAIVTATHSGAELAETFVGFTLICGALMCAWQARNRLGQERELIATADALRQSEATTRLREAQQEEIASFGQRALAGEPLETLMRDAVTTVTRVLDVEIAAILELREGGEELVIRVADGLPAEAMGHATVPAGDRSQSGYTLITGRPVVVDDWTREERFEKSQVLADLGAVSGVTVLIRGRGEPFGVIGLQSMRRRRFGEDSVSFLQSIATALANAIERRADEEDARERALHDPLTWLPNRALFADHLATALARQERRGNWAAVIFLDLDRFKLVNDGLGHQAGDDLLKMVAPRLKEALRPGDVVARFGGDEFAVLLDDITSERAATRVAERIAASLSQPFVLHGREHFVTASMGIALGSSTGQSEMLIRDADAAMYRAKELGRARYEIFDQEMRFRLAERLRIENELRSGIDHGELVLHYQPIISLSSGEVAGAEALVRWEHPERGLLLPGEFIDVAEESGLIRPMGRWVLEEACRQAAVWQNAAPDAPPLGIAINVSARQLSDPGFPHLVRLTLESAGIEPVSLSLELTESLVMDQHRASLGALRALHELGVRLALDDFGTGYSSLAYLKRLPLNLLKLDRRFISRLGTETDDAIVRAVVALGQSHDLGIVAEGVETAEQLEIVTALGCQYAQGFYFSRPVDRTQFGDLMRDPERIRARMGL